MRRTKERSKTTRRPSAPKRASREIDRELLERVRAAGRKNADAGIALDLRSGMYTQTPRNEHTPEAAMAMMRVLLSPDDFERVKAMQAEYEDEFTAAEYIRHVEVIGVVESTLTRDELIAAVRERRHPIAWMCGTHSANDVAEVLAGMDEKLDPSAFDPKQLAWIAGVLRAFGVDSTAFNAAFRMTIGLREVRADRNGGAS